MLGDAIESTLIRYRHWRARSAKGALGEFYRAGGNALLFRDLPVRSTEVVVDVGGFQGDWTAEMCWRYGCRAIVLEAVPEFATRIRERFEHNDRVVTLGVALARSDGEGEITVAADGSSLVREPRGANRVRIQTLAVETLFREHGLDTVACAKLNIEGSEYDVLDAMSAADVMARVRSFIVQFHDIGAETSPRLARARDALRRTHQQTFCFDLVWERWDLRR